VRVEWCFSVLQCVAVCFNVLQRWRHEHREYLCEMNGVAVCCSVLQYVSVHYRGGAVNTGITCACCSVLQCVAVCCRVLQRWRHEHEHQEYLCVLQCVALCCSVLQKWRHGHWEYLCDKTHSQESRDSCICVT